jgi:prepilin-type processing-associated H-X9-DG protein
MIQFDCTCGKRLETEEKYAGQQFPCPFCGAMLTVPGESQAIRPAGAAPVEYTAGRPDPGPGAGPQPGQHEPGPAVPRSGKALASLILGVLTFCQPVLLAIPAIILGILALVDINRSGGRLTGKGMAIAGLITGSVGNLSLIVMVLGVHNVRLAAMRTQSQHNLKIIGLAMHSYHDVNNNFPATAIYSKDGQDRPLLSWRVALLPYIERNALYKQFKLDEPWDSPHNIQLLSYMPAEYASLYSEVPPGHTHYLVFTGPKTPFDSPRGRPLREFPDGTPKTILVVEADDTVPWTKPADLEVAPERPLPRLGGLLGNGFNALFADGSVRFLDSRRVSEPTLRLLIDPNDGQQIPLDVLD